MSAFITSLRSEVQTDPTALGYAAPLAAKNDKAVAALINTVGAGASYSIFRKAIPVGEIIANIAAADFAALVSLQVAKLQLLFTGTSVLNATNANTRTIILGIFSGMATTIANLTAMASRQGSRAEVLYGEGTVITEEQIGLVRNGE